MQRIDNNNASRELIKEVPVSVSVIKHDSIDSLHKIERTLQSNYKESKNGSVILPEGSEQSRFKEFENEKGSTMKI